MKKTVKKPVLNVVKNTATCEAKEIASHLRELAGIVEQKGVEGIVLYVKYNKKRYANLHSGTPTSMTECFNGLITTLPPEVKLNILLEAM